MVVSSGIVHPKMKILSFTHPDVIPKLYDILASVKQKKIFLEISQCFLLTMEVSGNQNGLVSSKYRILCSTEESKYYR